MIPEITIRSRATGRRTGILAAKIMAVLSVPLIIYAFSSDPPTGLTGAPGEGTCASCHSSVTAGSGVTVTFPSLTYTPGGGAVSLTIAVPSGPGGFELSSRIQSNNTQAGTLTAGTNSDVATSGSIQYLRHSATASSWTASWTPPATNVGPVVVYIAAVGSSFSPTFTNNYTLTPVSNTPPTITVNPSTMTFSSTGGAVPPTQTAQVTSSGSAIPVTTSVSTTSGGNWLTATPPGGNTPVTVTVGVNPTGLATGTYSGTVSVASGSASNSPQTIAVTFTVKSGSQQPTLQVSPSTLSFTGTVGGPSPQSQSVQVTASDGSAQAFTAAVSTTPPGGTWLSVNHTTGTTPVTEAVSASLSGLAAGTYHGTVTLTSTGVSNSPVSIPVTLTVSSTGPSPGPLKFTFAVRDRQSGGNSQRMIISGSGSIDASGNLKGGGPFTIYGRGTDAIIAVGTWKATSVTSFTPPSGSGGGSDDGSNGGILVLQVNMHTKGGSTSTATMTISDTGSTSGVEVAISGGATFMPTGVGSVSITSGNGDGPSDDGGGTDH